jgi:hypothetical protein
LDPIIISYTKYMHKGDHGSASFTQEETEIISAIRSSFGLTTSQIIRNGVRMFAERMLPMYAATKPEHPVLKIALPVVEEIARIDGRDDPAVWEEVNQKSEIMVEKAFDIFTDHNPPGPRPKTRTRGHPSSQA